jgi:hypothetical protein
MTLPGATLINGFCLGIQPNVRFLRNLSLAVFALLLPALIGCANSTRPQVGSITFTTDSTGATPICTIAVLSNLQSSTPACTSALLPTLVAGGQAAYLYATVTGDNEALGVSWTVTCGSATAAGSGEIDTSCGTFQPAETLSGPVPLYATTGIVTTYNAPSTVPKSGTVTITAHATSLPSEAKSNVDPLMRGGSALEKQAVRLLAASPATTLKQRAQGAEFRSSRDG